MQNQLKIVIIIGIVVTAGIAGYFILSQQKISSPTSTSTSSTPISNGNTPIKSQELEGNESLVDILSKVEGVGPLQYETTYSKKSVNTPEVKAFAKVWQKLPLMRFDFVSTKGGEGKIIFLKDVTYVYDKSRDKYFREELIRPPGGVLLIPIEELSSDAKKQDYKILGNEVIDNKLATVIEFSLPASSSELPEITRKVWIWNKNGIVLKAENTEMNGTITTRQLGNFTFNNMADDVFEIPEDKKIEESSCSNLTSPCPQPW